MFTEVVGTAQRLEGSILHILDDDRDDIQIDLDGHPDDLLDHIRSHYLTHRISFIYHDTGAKISPLPATERQTHLAYDSDIGNFYITPTAVRYRLSLPNVTPSP